MTTKSTDDPFYSALLDDDAESLYEHAPCGYLSTTPDGTIIKVNQTFLTMTGYARESLVGQRTFASLLSAGGRIYHETHYAPMLRMEGTARAIALDVVRADGSRLPVLVNAVLQRTDGTPSVVRAAVFDATDRREYERELVLAKQRAEASEQHARALAQTLQQTLIPPTPPVIPHLDVAAAYRPAGSGDEVGGDFYDIFALGEDDWLIALGDVSGKGAEAAVVTALVRYTVRAAAVNASGLSAILHTVDEVLRAHTTDRFCTLALLRLQRQPGSGWRCALATAGHPLPYLLGTRSAQTVGLSGSAVGLVDDAAFPETSVDLTPGEGLLLFTDGVTEGRRGKEFYGDHRLGALVAASTGDAQSVVAVILEDVLAFQSQQPRDDIAIVAVQVPAG